MTWPAYMGLDSAPAPVEQLQCWYQHGFVGRQGKIAHNFFAGDDARGFAPCRRILLCAWATLA